MATTFREPDTYPHLQAAIRARLSGDWECETEVTVAPDRRRDEFDGTGGRRFDADLCVFDDGVPRVAVEVKHGGATTHDLTVYDRKVRRHRRVHGHLRYGLVVLEGESGLGERHLRHTRALDFCYVSDRPMADPGDLADDEMATLADLVEEQLGVSRRIEAVLAGDDRPTSYSRRLDFDGSP